MDAVAETMDTTVPEETLIEVPNVTLVFIGKPEEAAGRVGKLVLTSKLVTWTGEDEVCWDYRDILMHAISSEDGVPNLYAQIKGHSEFDVDEIRFVPENASILESLYAAFSRGACMNPDEPEDEGEAGNFFFNADNVRAELNGEEEDGEYEEEGEENGAE